jgi:hypothetical protein
MQALMYGYCKGCALDYGLYMINDKELGLQGSLELKVSTRAFEGRSLLPVAFRRTTNARFVISDLKNDLANKLELVHGRFVYLYTGLPLLKKTKSRDCIKRTLEKINLGKFDNCTNMKILNNPKPWNDRVGCIV